MFLFFSLSGQRSWTLLNPYSGKNVRWPHRLSRLRILFTAAAIRTNATLRGFGDKIKEFSGRRAELHFFRLGQGLRSIAAASVKKLERLFNFIPLFRVVTL